MLQLEKDDQEVKRLINSWLGMLESECRNAGAVSEEKWCVCSYLTPVPM